VGPAELAAVLTATAALVVAVTRLWIAIREVHDLVNSRMTELLELTRKASRAEGVEDSRLHPPAA